MEGPVVALTGAGISAESGVPTFRGEVFIVRHQRKAPRTILLVCTGNLCRSPMAAALLRRYLDGDDARRDWRVFSAGLWAEDGEPPSTGAVMAMAERGINLTGHRSRRLTPQMVEEADLILGMTPQHVEAMRQAFPEARDRIYLLAEMAGESHGIADPYGLSSVTYRVTANEIERLIRAGYERIVALAEGDRKGGGSLRPPL